MESVIPGNSSPNRKVKLLGETLAFDLDLNTPIVIDFKFLITDDDDKSYHSVLQIVNKGNSTIELKLVFQEKVLFNYVRIDLKILDNVETFDMNLLESNPTVYVSNPKKLSRIPEKVVINFFYMYYIFYETPHKFWTNTLEIENVSPKFTDIKLIVKFDDAEYSLNVNKIVLYYQSSVFRELIEADMLGSNTNTITIKDFSISTVREMVTFLYSNKVDFTLSRPHRLFRIAHIYDIQELQAECKHYYASELDIANVYELLELMSDENYDLNDMETILHVFVMKNASFLIKETIFMRMYKDTMNINNVHTRFEFAMRNEDKDFQYQVKSFIAKNAKEVMLKNDFLKLVLTLEWSIDLLEFISTHRPEAVDQ